MKRVTSVLILPLIIFMTFSGCSDYKSPSVQTLYRDYQAGRDIKKEKYEDALSKYYSLLEDDIERESTHSNIGVLLNMIQKPEEALKSLQHALKLAETNGNQEMTFKVRYNLGVYYGAIKKIPEALDNYQAALDIAPDSHEIKTNIELLMQQQKQNQNQQGDQGEQKKDKQSESGKDQSKDNKSDQEKNDKNPENNQNEKDKKDDQKKESSPKYQPRPFKGDQLSEGDVKKILGELKNQEQKIRANFDKKEKKGKTKNNEKDW